MVHLLILVLAFFLHLQDYAIAQERPSSEFREFSELLKTAELVGPSANDVRTDLNGYSQWRYTTIVRGGKAFMRFQAVPGTRAALRQKGQLSSSNRVTARWTTGERNYVTGRIILPKLKDSVQEIVLMTASAGDDNQLVQIIWRKDFQSKRDSYFVWVRPNANEVGSSRFFYLGPRDSSETSSTKFTITVDRNKMAVKMDDRTIVERLQLSNYGSRRLSFSAGLVLKEAMASPGDSAAVFIADLNWKVL